MSKDKLLELFVGATYGYGQDELWEEIEKLWYSVNVKYHNGTDLWYEINGERVYIDVDKTDLMIGIRDVIEED